MRGLWRLKKPKYWALYGAIALLLYASAPVPALFAAGLLFAAAGEAVRVWAVGHISKNQELAVNGPYAYVKNPLYIGTLLIGVGFCLMAGWRYVMIALGVFLALYFFLYMPRKIRKETRRLRDRFGEAYAEYDRQVRELIPRLTPVRIGAPRRWQAQLFLENHEIGIAFAIAAGIAILALKLAGILTFGWQ